VAETKLIAANRQARRNFDIRETFEAGLVLRGVEVKSLRESQVKLDEAYARFEGGELFLLGLHIGPYARAGTQGRVDPVRKRKLLLHGWELQRLRSKLDIERLSLVPLSLYFKDGRAKVELGLGKGRREVDKRQLIAQRDAEREARRELARANRRL
jgi:SsrA-binding protein